MQPRTRRISRIAILDLRMDLVIAMLHLAAVINVRQAHRASAWECKSPRAAAVVLQVSSEYTVAVLQTVAGGDAIAEV